MRATILPMDVKLTKAHKAMFSMIALGGVVA